LTQAATASASLRIVGGTVYDPANGVDGEVRDIHVAGGRIVADAAADARTIDARGMIVMPGGVDIHCHVAGSSVNLARRFVPEEHRGDPASRPPFLEEPALARSGTGGTVPSTFTTGYRYAGLGYTTVFDAAVAPVSARLSHAELDDTPLVDAGFFVLLGNDEFLLQQLAAGEHARARDYVAWMLQVTGAYGIKLVNPGGVELWKRGARERTELDTRIGGTAVTPRAIIASLVDAAESLRLPHAAHIHCNNLGVPGNVRTTVESMEAVAGRRAHFTHLQFHGYDSTDKGGWRSGARTLIEYINAHQEVTADVGQVMFGPAMTLTADGPVEYLLSRSTGRKWLNVDVELETGCGIVPYSYKEQAAVAALQWVVGLELFLLSGDPWRVLLSTDHPNGGSFLAYPELMRLLMDRTYRDEQLKRVNTSLLAGSALADGLTREYTLNEIAIISRAGPARALGLTRKGHLGVGADADVTVYAGAADAATMFATPRYVVKGGVLVVEEGQLRRVVAGQRLHVRPEFEQTVVPHVKDYFERYGSVAFENYGADPPRDPAQPLRGVPR
jgi:formylmethanofuran dehydrogenase subunit A